MGKRAARHFVTETDPDTFLASMSRGYTFRVLVSDSMAIPAALNEPFVEVEIDRPSGLVAETFKWEAATILASASLGVDPFDLSHNRVPRAFAQEMLEQLTRGENPLQRSARITEGLIQLYADGMTRQEISSLSLVEAVRSFFRILTPGRHVSLLVDMACSEEVHSKFITLHNVLSTMLDRPVWMAFGPYSEGYSGYFFRDSLRYGPCIIFTTDSPVDKSIPGADYTFGQLHQIMALSEYDTLVHWRRPVIRLHLSAEPSAALDQVRHIFGKACAAYPPEPAFLLSPRGRI